MCGLAALAPEVILPLPAKIEPLQHVRSTLLMSSYSTLRELGRSDAYLAKLPSRFHATILEGVAGTWVPVEVALAHYNACDMLGLSSEDQIAMGRRVGDRIQGTLLGTVVRMAKEAGVTPLTVLPHWQRFWNRACDGGGLYANKLGPKEVEMGMRAVILADCSYFRVAVRGLMQGLLDLFCRKSYVREHKPEKRKPGTGTFRIQWA
jgi:hypothetical protein